MEPDGPRARRDPIELAIENWTAQGWADATPGMAMVTSVMRGSSCCCNRSNGCCARWALTFARYEVLGVLVVQPDRRPTRGQDRRAAAGPPASVTNVDRLGGRRAGPQDRNPQDGRSVLARITGARAALAAEASAELELDVFTKVPLPVADLDSLFAVMRATCGGPSATSPEGPSPRRTRRAPGAAPWQFL